MARKRMISPSMWESESFSEISDLAKLVFISMISHADDEGRGKASPAYIKSMTFPNDENRRVADIKSALSEIARCMSVQFYSADGRDYYVMTNWTEYQKIDKPTKSKLPPPPNVGVGGAICNRGQFGEDSTNTRGVVGENSTPKSSQYNIIQDNISVCNIYVKEFCDKWNVKDDTTDTHLENIDFEKLNAAYAESKKFLQIHPSARFMSWIVKHYESIVADKYKDFCESRKDKSISEEWDDYLKNKTAEEINAVFAPLNEEL